MYATELVSAAVTGLAQRRADRGLNLSADRGLGCFSPFFLPQLHQGQGEGTGSHLWLVHHPAVMPHS